MNCAEMRELLDRYLLGTLADPEVQNVRQHLAACEECRRFHQDRVSLMNVLDNTLQNPRVPEGLEARIMARVTGSPSRRFWKYVPLSMAAALMIGIGIYFWAAHNSRPFIEVVSGNLTIAGDRITTDKGQSGVVTLAGEIRVRVDSDTALTIERSEGKASARRVRLDRGGIDLEVSKRAEPFTVSTEVGEVAVLGTKFDVALEKVLEVTPFPDVVESTWMSVSITEGAVSVRNAHGEEKLKAGERALVRQNQPPEKGFGRDDILNRRTNEAITRGVKYLLDYYKDGLPDVRPESELLVYTLIHSDVNPVENKLLADALDNLMGRSLERHFPSKYSKYSKEMGQTRTYTVAVSALALHSFLVKIKSGKLDAKSLKWKVTDVQKKIADLAQWLVDSQLDHGQWTYLGNKTHEPVKDTLTTGVKDDGYVHVHTWQNIAGVSGVGYKIIPKSGKINRNKTDIKSVPKPGSGDNSNTHYAVLGLIAAQLSGCMVPVETWERTLQWFENYKTDDGGFGYGRDGKAENGKGYPSTGSMTTAGAVALAASYRFLGKDYKNEQKFKDAVAWLTKNFTVSANPGDTEFHYYYLYGLERVGAFINEPRLGNHDWYKEGAEYLLKIQHPNGSWEQRPDGSWPDNAIKVQGVNTCFAILFLRRATAGLIDTGIKGPEKVIDTEPPKSNGGMIDSGEKKK